MASLAILLLIVDIDLCSSELLSELIKVLHGVDQRLHVLPHLMAANSLLLYRSK